MNNRLALKMPYRLSSTLALLTLGSAIAPIAAQNTELRRTYTYFNWNLAGMPLDIRANALATDSLGQTLAVYSQSNGSYGGYILLKDNGWQSLQAPSQLLSAKGFLSSGTLALTNLSGTGIITGFGTTQGGARGFAWSGGSLVGIAVPGAISTEAHAINVRGKIAGMYLVDRSSYLRGFVLDPNTGFRDVLAPGGRYMTTKLTAINLQGDVAGTYTNNGAGNSSDNGAFIATTDGRIFYIDASQVFTEDGYVSGLKAAAVSPTGINQAGEVVGTFVERGFTRGFYYYNGVFRVLEGPPPSNCPNRLQYPKIDPSVWAPFRVSGIDDNGAIFGSADCKFFTGVAPSRPPAPWYAGKPSMDVAGPSAHGNTMLAGQVLRGDESITSLNGKYTFTYQADGNLVLYRNSDHFAMWSSKTYQTTVGVAIMQSDGNFVVYDRHHGVQFTSHTSKNPGSFLRVQDDGNVVVYTLGGQAPWSTHTVQLKN